MNFSFYKKAIALTMAISLPAALLSGCKTKEIPQPTQSTPPNVSKPTNTDPLGKYDPSINISFVRGIDDDLAANILPKTPGETIEDNRWLKLYKDELGINIKYNWTVKGSYTSDAYMQKINVTLASGDLPDVTIVNATQLKQLVDAGLVEDMTKYFNDYAAPLTKEVYANEGPGVLDSATFDGKLMAVPNVDASIESAQFLWIRADWLKKLNLQPPKTMDDLLKIAEAFTKMDPDGNGKNDTYGLAATKDLYSGAMGLNGFFNGYHAYPNFWKEIEPGKLAYGSIQPEMKTALKKLADMYKAGQIDKEFGVKDGAKVSESIAAGKIGIDFGEQWNPMYPLISNYNNDRNADWTGYPVVSVDSNAVKVPLKFRTSLYLAVKKGYKNPEAVVKLINMHLEKNWGKTNDFGKYYMPAENGNVGVWKFSPVTPAPTQKNLNAFLEIEKARNAKDMSILKGEAKVIQSNIDAYQSGDKSQWGWEKIYGVNGVYNVLKQYKANNQLMIDKFVGAPTKTMVERKATLDKMEKEVFVKIIMGESSADEFDKFVSDWNKLGGEAITKEVNEWYKSVKSK
jgi:putative aldouronate transport system substrate-binding protein